VIELTKGKEKFSANRQSEGKDSKEKQTHIENQTVLFRKATTANIGQQTKPNSAVGS
jgi:hypothetical protein